MADPADVLGFGRTPPHDYDLRRPRGRRSAVPRPIAVALTALGGLLVGFLLTTGMSAGREEAQAQLERKDELIALITERQERADELAGELEDMRARVDEARAEATAGVPALEAEIERAELAAGVADLRGPGLRLVLDDGDPASCPSTEYVCRIQDSDVQQAVNALFEAGAEAVAVGDERVVATTTVRGVGQTIIVNLRILAAPYELTAIGDPDELADRLEQTTFAQDFASWTQDYGLTWSVEEEDDVRIPRYGLTVGMDAQPPDGHSSQSR